MKKLNLWIIVGALLWAPLCLAQTDGPPARDGYRGERGPRDGGERRAHRRGNHEEIKKRMLKMRARILRKRVGLTEDRARKAEQVFERFEPAHKKARKRMKLARKTMRKLIRSNSQDNAAFEKALEDMRNARIGMDNFHDQIHDALKVELSARERAILFVAMKRMHQRVRQRMQRGGQGKHRGQGQRGRRGQRGPDNR